MAVKISTDPDKAQITGRADGEIARSVAILVETTNQPVEIVGIDILLDSLKMASVEIPFGHQVHFMSSNTTGERYFLILEFGGGVYTVSYYDGRDHGIGPIEETVGELERIIEQAKQTRW